MPPPDRKPSRPPKLLPDRGPARASDRAERRPSARPPTSASSARAARFAWHLGVYDARTGPGQTPQAWRLRRVLLPDLQSTCAAPAERSPGAGSSRAPGTAGWPPSRCGRWRWSARRAAATSRRTGRRRPGAPAGSPATQDLDPARSRTRTAPGPAHPRWMIGVPAATSMPFEAADQLHLLLVVERFEQRRGGEQVLRAAARARTGPALADSAGWPPPARPGRSPDLDEVRVAHHLHGRRARLRR